MSQSKSPEGFSLQFGSRSPEQSSTDLFLKTATTPTYPFLRIKLKKSASVDDTNLEVSVSSKLYEYTRATLLTDEILLYPSNAQFNHWTYDMVIGIKTLINLKLFEPFDAWVSQSRKCMSALLNNQKFEPEFKLENAKKKSEELLKSLNIFDEVNKQELIFNSAQEALKEKSMDSSTLIYRLAMAVYHSKRGSDSSLINAVDDTSETYLTFVKSKIFDENKEHFSEMMDLPSNSRVQVMKVLISFIIATYAYYKVID